MFKHAKAPAAATSKDGGEIALEIESTEKSARPEGKDTSPAALYALLEKNLKWSQIIYEQNRKINRKLLWAAVSNWLRLVVVVVPLVVGVWYLPTILRELKDKYGLFLNAAAKGQISPSTVNSLLDFLPINGLEREQLKAILQQQAQK